MATPSVVEPVKPIVAVLWADEEARDGALEALAARWSPVDHQSADLPFDATDYYESEMGCSLRRRLVSFARCWSPQRLPERKLETCAIEDAWRAPTAGRGSPAGGRRVNLDCGYLDLSKVVLASLKPAGQKIALARGVWADPILRYREGRYRPFEWTFPDLRDGRWDEDLARIRERYRAWLRAWRRERSGEPPA